MFKTHKEGEVRKRSHDLFCKNYPQGQEDKDCKLEHLIFKSKSLPLLKNKDQRNSRHLLGFVTGFSIFFTALAYLIVELLAGAYLLRYGVHIHFDGNNRRERRVLP